MKMPEKDETDETIELMGVDHLFIFELDGEQEIINQRGSSLSNEEQDDG